MAISSQHAADRHSPQAVLDQLERLNAQVADLTNLAARQSAVIDSGETEELLNLLAKRQEIVTALMQAQSALGPTSPKLRAAMDAANDGDRTRISELIESLQTGLANVLAQDRKDEEAMQVVHGKLGRELEKTSASRIARRAYIAPASGGNRFADRRG